MTTRRQAQRLFRECFPAHLQRARQSARTEWFQSLSPDQRVQFLWRYHGLLLERYGAFPDPLPIHKRFPHTDPAKIQIVSIPETMRAKAVAEALRQSHE